MRKKIVAGNWKMNNNKSETAELIQALKSLSFSNMFVRDVGFQLMLVSPTKIFHEVFILLPSTALFREEDATYEKPRKIWFCRFYTCSR